MIELSSVKLVENSHPCFPQIHNVIPLKDGIPSQPYPQYSHPLQQYIKDSLCRLQTHLLKWDLSLSLVHSARGGDVIGQVEVNVLAVHWLVETGLF